MQHHKNHKPTNMLYICIFLSKSCGLKKKKKTPKRYYFGNLFLYLMYVINIL